MYDRTTRGCCLAVAIGAMIALAPSATRAQSVQSTTTTTVTETYPVIVPTIEPPPMGPNGQPIDFNVLIASPFVYSDLVRAHYDGFSDAQIAGLEKVAVLAEVPFQQVEEQAVVGKTLPVLAIEYNLRVKDVWDVSDYQDKIAAFKLAYENTGAGKSAYPSGAAYFHETSDDNLAAIVNSSPDLTTFARAIRTAHMERDLRRDGPLTVFAPTDAAFAKLPSDQLSSLMGDRHALTQMVHYCILPRRLDSASALAMSSPAATPSLTGDPLTFTSAGSSLMVNGATVTKPDVFASNGVLHEIDTVLLPPTVTLSTTTTTTTISPVTTIMPNGSNTTIAPSTTLAPNSTTSVAPNGATITTTPNATTSVEPNGTTTTLTPNGTTTVEPNGNTTITPAAPSGSTVVTPNPNGSTTVTPAP